MEEVYKRYIASKIKSSIESGNPINFIDAVPKKCFIESINSENPLNINQERYLNFGNFYSCKGSSFINYIVEKISIMDDKILIIDLED